MYYDYDFVIGVNQYELINPHVQYNIYENPNLKPWLSC